MVHIPDTDFVHSLESATMTEDQLREKYPTATDRQLIVIRELERKEYALMRRRNDAIKDLNRASNELLRIEEEKIEVVRMYLLYTNDLLAQGNTMVSPSKQEDDSWDWRNDYDYDDSPDPRDFYDEEVDNEEEVSDNE